MAEAKPFFMLAVDAFGRPIMSSSMHAKFVLDAPVQTINGRHKVELMR